jgi:ectoine hydroxylase-related dioxygenase (phytanoyl-CoA dioxygenase family)
MLTPDQLTQYATSGYVVLPSLLAADEVAAFRDAARADLERHAAGGDVMHKADAEGNVTLLKLWNQAGDDIYRRVARDQRLVDIAVDVLGEDTYVYSHKMTMKQPRTGGAWEWHQDYGYWYQNRCLVPDMTSIWIALDPSHADNGCLQVLEASHRIGRLDHLRVNDQTVVDAEYLDAAVARFELRYVEMEPGDALVLHCNMLHRSDANRSDEPRWGYIVSYNTAANRPFRDVRDYGRFEELHPVPAGSFRNAASPER